MKQRRGKAGAGTPDAAAARPAEAPVGDDVSLPDAAEAPGAQPAPPPPPAHLARAHELMARGAYVQAAEAFGAALAENAEDVDAIAGLGASHLARAQFDGAEREFRKAIKLAPNAPEVNYQLGVTLFKRGVYAAAAQQLRRAIELDRDHAFAHVMLGEALNHTGESEAAIEALEHAIELQPENGKAYYALGIAYDRKGQHDRAAEMYRRSREVGGR